jgi:hypothetical protein
LQNIIQASVASREYKIGFPPERHARQSSVCNKKRQVVLAREISLLHKMFRKNFLKNTYLLLFNQQTLLKPSFLFKKSYIPLTFPYSFENTD